MRDNMFRKGLVLGIFLIIISGVFSVSSLDISTDMNYASSSFSSVVIYKTVGDPNMTGSGGSPDWWATSNTPIWIDAEAFGSNLSSVMYKVNSGNWINIPLNELPKDIYLSGNCVHYLYIKATDDDGNIVYDNETFYIDNKIPGTGYGIYDPWGFHPSGAYLITKDSFYMWIAVEQGVAPCIVGYLDIYYNYWFEGNWTNYSQSFNQHGEVGYQAVDNYQQDGVHHFNWYCNDGLGNRWPATNWTNITFYVDNLPPDFVIDINEPYGFHPGDDSYYISDDTIFYLNATDNDTYYPALSEDVDLYYRYWYDNSWSTWNLVHKDNGTVSKDFQWQDEGTYYLEYFADDMLGNRNPSSGQFNSTFYVDNTPPALTDNSPTQGYSGESYTFNSTVTDDVKVSNVTVEYWYGSGSHTNVSMSNVGGDCWESTIVVENTLDTMHYIISASDLVSNWADTGVLDVTIIDRASPIIIDNSPSHAAAGREYTFSAVVFDNILVDDCWVEYWYDGGEHENDSMVNVGSDVWENMIIVNQTATILHYFISAVDSSDNWNQTVVKDIVITPNNCPNAPSIDGPHNGKVGEEYSYVFISDDPETDNVYYFVDWGDETNTSWVGPFASGDPQTFNHTWVEEGTFTISARAKDIFNDESKLSTLEVTMPRNKLLVKTLFLRFFERILDVFLILRQLIQRLELQ